MIEIRCKRGEKFETTKSDQNTSSAMYGDPPMFGLEIQSHCKIIDTGKDFADLIYGYSKFKV